MLTPAGPSFETIFIFEERHVESPETKWKEVLDFLKTLDTYTDAQTQLLGAAIQEHFRAIYKTNKEALTEILTVELGAEKKLTLLLGEDTPVSFQLTQVFDDINRLVDDKLSVERVVPVLRGQFIQSFIIWSCVQLEADKNPTKDVPIKYLKKATKDERLKDLKITTHQYRDLSALLECEHVASMVLNLPNFIVWHNCEHEGEKCSADLGACNTHFACKTKDHCQIERYGIPKCKAVPNEEKSNFHKVHIEHPSNDLK
jgi:hypothetical protein